MKDELLYLIGLNLVPGIGPKLAKKLLAYCGGAKAVFEESPKLLQKIPQIGAGLTTEITTQKVLQKAEKELSFAEKNGIDVLSYQCAEFPNRLHHCEDAPTILFKKGKSSLNAVKMISVVGTRKATPYGKKWCKQIVEQLTAHQTTIVSGLAYGIDTMAHKTALTVELPTIAVLGHGLDRVYPAANRKLSEQIQEKGALLTEFLTETNPDRENFVKRNRIVAGITDATIVVESAKKGGALITANIANSYDRDVFAVPGTLDCKQSQGCNHLIKTNQAALLTDVADIEYLMGWSHLGEVKPMLFSLTPEEEELISLFNKKEAIHVDQLISQSAYSAGRVAKILLSLEMQNAIQSLPGKRYQLR